MPRKHAPPADDPGQSKRFIATARDVGAAKTEEETERAFKKIAKKAASEEAAAIEASAERLAKTARHLKTTVRGLTAAWRRWNVRVSSWPGMPCRNASSPGRRFGPKALDDRTAARRPQAGS